MDQELFAKMMADDEFSKVMMKIMSNEAYIL
jgi:hypothetical protein